MAYSNWYSTTPEASQIPPEVAERALEWLVDLQTEPVPAPMVEEWLKWRAAHPDHERAWQRIESVNSKLQPLSISIQSGIAQATLMPAKSSRRRQVIKTLALFFFTGGAAWVFEEHTPWREWSADQRTQVGEQRSMALEDGTQLVLNTNSAINIRYTYAVRRIVLVAGEVLISTGKDPQADARPFVLETTQGSALALGTKYAVRQLADDTRVSVFSGAVEIRPLLRSAKTLVIHAGQEGMYSAHSITEPRSIDQSSIAWASGLIVARSMRLEVFIKELSRYSQDTLSCDPAVAQLRVSGSFPLNNIGTILDTVSATLGLRIERVTRIWGHQAVRIRA